jgi:hypothetical protein
LTLLVPGEGLEPPACGLQTVSKPIPGTDFARLFARNFSARKPLWLLTSCYPVVAPHQGNKNPAVRMPSRNQSSCSQLWFCRSRSWGGRHGQADQRVAADDLHGRVHRERHIRRNPAPLSRRANLVRAGSFVLSGSRSRFWPAVHFGGREKRAAGNGPAAWRFRARTAPQPWPPVRHSTVPGHPPDLFSAPPAPPGKADRRAITVPPRATETAASALFRPPRYHPLAAGLVGTRQRAWDRGWMKPGKRQFLFSFQ